MEITKKSYERIGIETSQKLIPKILFLIALLAAAMCLTALSGCSSSDNGTDPPPTGTGTIKGTVTDEDGNTYPSTLITIIKGSEKTSGATDDDGIYTIQTKDIGTYSIEVIPPLSTLPVGTNPNSVTVRANQIAIVDFVIQPQTLEAVLSLGIADIFNEIKDKDGNDPSDPNEPLYAANFFQEPIGLLTAIKAPDGHHVTLSEFKEAKGTFKVHCDGKKTTVEIALEGMIPNGVYTTWLGYFNKVKKVGESLSLDDFVFSINPPLGSPLGTENVLIAGADGTVNVTIEHASCILTDEVALGMPISYHINGNTYGAGEIPDAEEVTQLLVYFQ